MINRFSSRRQRLDRSFLAERLRGAQGYDRIAGFFSSSILGVAGEELESISGPVRLVCNSSLDPKDIETAKQAAQAALRREWCDAEPERLPDAAKPRFQRLYDFLASGKLQVRVLPDAIFGLIHGKAGVITLADGRKTAFLGSVNESLTAWRLNYELLWEDDYENGIEYPTTGPESIRKCPRRVGIVSTGLIIAGSEISDWLINGRYECVILDEAHRARRRNLGSGKEYDPAEPNKLLRFLWDISPRTRSLLLATATPVQLHPIEAWDLLDALAKGSDAILGGYGSPWRRPRQALGLLLDETPPPTEEIELWGWMRNPLPPAAEGPDYRALRRSLGLSDQAVMAPGGSFERLGPPDRARIRRIFPRFLEQSNPFIRHIVLRTREYLETSLDPETGEPFLKPVAVRLHGERDEDAIRLPPFLEDAYRLAEEFCRLLAQRANAGLPSSSRLSCPRRRSGSMPARSAPASCTAGSSPVCRAMRSRSGCARPRSAS